MLFLVGLCLLATSQYVLGECSDGCKEPTLFYEGLNCKPVYASPDDCCPSEYDCSHIEARANEEKCYFHGKAYNLGEQISNDELYGYCKVGCTCRKTFSGKMDFMCAILDCIELLGSAAPGCHFKRELDKCCGGKEVCAPFSTTCEVNGHTYHEGRRFRVPNNKCVNCVCEEGFDGKFEAPFCKKRQCIEEVDRQSEVQNFCAPSFIRLNDCCPRIWVCPEKDDKIVPAATPFKDTNLKCKFGEHRLNLGDTFKRTRGGELSCECRIPPYLTCIHDYMYPVYGSEY